MQLATIQTTRIPIFSDIFKCSLILNQQTLILGSKDETIQNYDLQTLQLKQRLSYHQNSVCALQNQDEKYFYSASLDNSIIKWELQPNNLIKFIQKEAAHSSGISRLNKYMNRYLISGDYDGMILIWDLQKFQLKESIKAFSSKIQSIMVHEKKKQLILNSKLSEIKIYNLETFNCEFKLSMKYHKLKTMLYMQNTGYLISTGGNNEIILCNLSQPEPEALRKINVPRKAPIMLIENEKIMVIGQDNATVVLIDLFQLEIVNIFGNPEPSNEIRCLSYNSQLKQIIAVDKSKIAIYNTRLNPGLLQQVNVTQNQIQSMQYVQENDIMITSVRQGSVYSYDLAKNKVQNIFKSDEINIQTAISLNSDAKNILILTNNQLILYHNNIALKQIEIENQIQLILNPYLHEIYTFQHISNIFSAILVKKFNNLKTHKNVVQQPFNKFQVISGLRTIVTLDKYQNKFHLISTSSWKKYKTLLGKQTITYSDFIYHSKLKRIISIGTDQIIYIQRLINGQKLGQISFHNPVNGLVAFDSNYDLYIASGKELYQIEMRAKTSKLVGKNHAENIKQIYKVYSKSYGEIVVTVAEKMIMWYK